jgi:hypothetical protein
VGEYLKDRAWIHGPDPSHFKRLQEGAFDEGGYSGLPEERREVSLIHRDQTLSLLEEVGVGYSVALREWLKHHHIKWLKGVGWMEREDHYQDPPLVTILNKLIVMRLPCPSRMSNL